MSKIVCLAMLVTSCSSPESVPKIRAWHEHGPTGSVVLIAAEEAKYLLDVRIDLGTKELDATILELSKLICADVPPVERERLLVLPLEELYPMREWKRCEVLVCGGCYGAGIYRYGDGVATPPSVE